MVNKERSLELSHKLMIEATMYYENTVLEQKKQLEIGGIAKNRIGMEDSRE